MCVYLLSLAEQWVHQAFEGQIVGELVGSGKFVNQNTLVAGYYPRMARFN